MTTSAFTNKKRISPESMFPKNKNIKTIEINLLTIHNSKITPKDKDLYKLTLSMTFNLKNIFFPTYLAKNNLKQNRFH